MNQPASSLKSRLFVNSKAAQNFTLKQIHETFALNTDGSSNPCHQPITHPDTSISQSTIVTKTESINQTRNKFSTMASAADILVSIPNLHSCATSYTDKKSNRPPTDSRHCLRSYSSLSSRPSVLSSNSAPYSAPVQHATTSTWRISAIS